MVLLPLCATLALIAVTLAQNTQTSAAAVASAAATALTTSPTSHVPGKAFDRFVVIWLENTDYDKAVGDPNLAWLAEKGITLSNYFGVTHPSQPNYVASIGGDNFGMDNDNFNQIEDSVFTVTDLLEDRGISWGSSVRKRSSLATRMLTWSTATRRTCHTPATRAFPG